VVEREDALDLTRHGRDVVRAVELARDVAGVVLAEDDARVPVEVVAAEGEPHHRLVRRGSPGVGAEPEAGEQGEAERPARVHRQRRHGAPR